MGNLLVTVQPWGLDSVSGGSRVMRALLDRAPMAVHSISTTPEPPKGSSEISESHVPHRPWLGKIDYSRFARFGTYLDRPYRSNSQKRLRAEYQRLGASVIHLIAHGFGFATAYLAAKDLGLPVILTVHDDLRFTLQGNPETEFILKVLSEAWKDSAARIVISDEMGEEYSRRYSDRPFTVITDGLETVSPYKPGLTGNTPRTVYFMGLLHQGCIQNFGALLNAISRLNSTANSWNVVLRCGRNELPFDPALLSPVTFLPYGSQADVEADMKTVSVLYQPLPIGEEFLDMNRFSLSTKMISYLGSGKPILYHGPEESATGHLLSRSHSAVASTSMAPSEIADALELCITNAASLVENAGKLCKERFMLVDQHNKFWTVVQGALELKTGSECAP